MAEIAGGLFEVHAVEVVAQGDALIQGGQPAEFEAPAESGLADEEAGEGRAGVHVIYELRDLRDVSPERDGCFDLVFSAKTLHHVHALDDALRAMRSLLNPGGRVVLLDIVAPQPAIPRWWFRREALRSCVADVVQRRRPLREAIELLRLLMHPEWLDHVTTDRFLSPSEFRQRYGGVFPGGQFTDLYYACLLTWQAERA